MQLSVIIPALNEAVALPRLLGQLRQQRGIELQIIVAGGGSTDATAAIAAATSAVTVRSASGRGTQMNAGARIAAAPWLLFLHADSQLRDANLLAHALAAMPVNQNAAGHFALRFEREHDGEHDFFYRYLEGKTWLNRAYTINGDQGMLISAEYFRQLGGYDERLPFLEDQRLAAKIFAGGRWILLPGELITSARRFETEGVRERYTMMALIMGLHAAGVDEFFAQAPRVYAAQCQTARLNLRPYLQLIYRVLRERGRWRTLYRAGAFVRENAWQIFYYRDVRRGDGRWSWLNFNDRYFMPLISNPAGDFVTALLLALWLYGWLPLNLLRRD